MRINIKSAVALSASFLIIGSVNAQKAKVVSAYNYNKSYERDKECSELEKGINAITPATTDEKTGTWAKTWYYGGNLFFNAALAQDQTCAEKYPEALDNAFEYYLNAMKYNIEDGGAANLDLEKDADAMKFMGFIMNKNTQYEDRSYTMDIMLNKFPYLANAFVNRGVEKFQAGDYEKAKEYSLKSVSTNAFLGKVDSLGMYNAALSAERLEQDEEAVQLYTALTQIKYGGAPIYLYIAKIHEGNKDSTKMLEAIQNGLKAYPTDADLVREELSFLLTSGQTDKALSKFADAIANEPDNPTLYYNRGLINDQMGNVEDAAFDYNKALDVDPEFFDAAYNLGAMYYNLGVEWNNKASNYGLNETAKYKEANAKASDLFKKAQPALEKAHSIKPEDKNTMASLTKIYAIIGEDAKYEEMKAKLQGN